jgi:Outer membrane lipoprotein-sorting protein
MFLSLPAFAQDISPTGPVAGAELAAKIRVIRPQEDMEWPGTLVTSHRKPKVPPVSVVCRETAGVTNWSRIYMTAPNGVLPAETLKVVFSSNAPPRYFFARAPSTNAPVGELKELSAAEANVPLGGSDFWLSDLALDFLNWPVQVQRPGEIRSSRECFVLESLNPHPDKTGYSRVKLWIDKEQLAPLEAYAYRMDDTNGVLKAFTVGSVKKVSDGHYEIKDIQMNNRQTGSTTWLVFDLEGK